jgi:hypothetical protein
MKNSFSFGISKLCAKSRTKDAIDEKSHVECHLSVLRLQDSGSA